MIGDVGQSAREEIDWAPAAQPRRSAPTTAGTAARATKAGPATDPECKTPPAGGFIAPVFDYPHENPGGGAAQGCAIIGGYVVRDPSLGGLYGRYLYGDLCNGEIRSLVLAEPAASDRSESLTVENLNSFGEDSCGRLYAVSGNGPVYRLVGPTPNTCPTAATTPPTVTPRSPSAVGIRAVTRRVRNNGRAQITAYVTPCTGRRGEPVTLLQRQPQARQPPPRPRLHRPLPPPDPPPRPVPRRRSPKTPPTWQRPRGSWGSTCSIPRRGRRGMGTGGCTFRWGLGTGSSTNCCCAVCL